MYFRVFYGTSKYISILKKVILCVAVRNSTAHVGKTLISKWYSNLLVNINCLNQ